MIEGKLDELAKITSNEDDVADDDVSETRDVTVV
jgi:hypothetical protein